MSRMKFFTVVLMFAAVVFAFTGCSKSEEKSSGVKVETNVQVKTDVKADVEVKTPVETKTDVKVSTDGAGSAVSEADSEVSAVAPAPTAAEPEEVNPTALKEEIVIAETFNQDWVVGTWTMILEGSSGYHMEGDCDISGINPDDQVVGDGIQETFAEFTKELFEGILISFSEGTIAQLKNQGATVKGDGKLRVNAERNEMRATLTASFGSTSQTISFTMKKK